MSKVLREYDKGPHRKNLSHIVEVENGTTYYVDSCNTLDRGYETMAFLFDNDSCKVVDWDESYGKWYDSEEEMIEGHQYAIENLEECILLYGYEEDEDAD